MNNQKKIVIIGAGGHAKSCIDIIEKQNKYKIHGIIGAKEEAQKEVLNYKVIGSESNLGEIVADCSNAFIAIGHIKDNKVRTHFYYLLKNIGFELPTIISPEATVSKYSTIGDSTIIMHSSVVNAGTSIGSNCIINSKALIEHDVTIGNDCHISTGVILNGSVTVNNSSFVGSGTIINQSIEIRKNSIIPSGSIIKENII